MEAAKVNRNLMKQGYFQVDHKGIIRFLSSELIQSLDLKPSEWIDSPMSQFFKCRIPLEDWEGKNKVFHGFIRGEVCLVHIYPCAYKDWTGYTCNILVHERDVSSQEILEFWKSMKSDGENSRKSPNKLAHKYSFDEIIGKSSVLNEAVSLASRVAMSRSTVLISGENGTGKELFAHAIHDTSPRRDGPFVAINCAAIPEPLFESELFGYEGGAFSGARREGKPGKVELAHNGTLFLDEISELPLLMQGKLLRVLQEREVERVGATGQKTVDIRIVAATNKSLDVLVKEGKFRQDLYFRLKVFELEIPPLRERKEDILPLAYHFIEDYNRQFNLEIQHLEPALQDWLLSYQWPGNVRELQAAIERGMNIADGDTLLLGNVRGNTVLPVEEREPTAETERKSDETPTPLPLKEHVAQAEIASIRYALQKSSGDVMVAAQLLDIHLASLYRKIAKYKIK